MPLNDPVWKDVFLPWSAATNCSTRRGCQAIDIARRTLFAQTRIHRVAPQRCGTSIIGPLGEVRSPPCPNNPSLGCRSPSDTAIGSAANSGGWIANLRTPSASRREKNRGKAPRKPRFDCDATMAAGAAVLPPTSPPSRIRHFAYARVGCPSPPERCPIKPAAGERTERKSGLPVAIPLAEPGEVHRTRGNRSVPWRARSARVGDVREHRRRSVRPDTPAAQPANAGRRHRNRPNAALQRPRGTGCERGSSSVARSLRGTSPPAISANAARGASISRRRSRCGIPRR